MDKIRKLFPLSQSMNNSLKRFAIGVLIYAGILWVISLLLSLMSFPSVLLAAIPYVGVLLGVIVYLFKSVPLLLASVYCYGGVILLTVLFWRNRIERNQLKRFFPLAFVLLDNKSDFIVSLVLYGVAYVLIAALFMGITLALLLISSLVFMVTTVFWMYFMVTVTLHILAYIEAKKRIN